MLKYFTRLYNFDFFLRVDDDYFVCLQHLLAELPQRPTTALWWGWIHCFHGIVRVDEGFTILTFDIIKESLDRLNTTLMCSALGDQAVALWVTSSKLNVTYFYDNDRLLHSVPENEVRDYLVSGICDRYIGIHQAYPKYMYQYWRVMRYDDVKHKKKREKSIRNIHPVTAIPKFSKRCRLSTAFDWRGFRKTWSFEPKPCRNDPTWEKSTQEFLGRQSPKGSPL